MSDGFLSRWARRKAEARETPAAEAAPPPAAVAPEPASEPAPLPDVAELHAESDYSPFLAEDVPADLRRQALRKLWGDPAFAAAEVMDVHAVGLPGPTFGGAVATLFRVGQGMAEMLPEEEPQDAADAAEEGQSGEV